MDKARVNYLTELTDNNLSLVEEPQMVMFDDTETLIEKYRQNGSKKINGDNFFNYTPVIAEGHTAPYKIHKYFARRPWNVFEQLVQNFSKENEIVLDPFCGGGVTIYESIRKGRKVIGCDLNPLSIFVVRNMVKKNILTPDFITAIDDLRKYLVFLNGSFMQFNYEGLEHQTEWCEVAFKVKCNVCNEPTLLSNDLKTKNGFYKCMNPKCATHLTQKKAIEARNCERIGLEYLFLVNNYSQGKKIVKKFEQQDFERLNAHIEFLNSEIKKEKIKIPTDKIPLDWDRQFEDGLAKKGIYNFQDLFTERNLLIVSLLLNKIKSYSKNLSDDKYELLRMIFSNTVKDTNIMAFTNETWQGGKPTTWSKHAYWIPSQFCEVSILPSFEKSIQRIISSLKFNNTQKYEVATATSFSDLTGKNLLLYNKPVAFTDIPENSVDAIITDPPYGSNVQYLELSHFWFVWNKDLYDTAPDFKLEAVSNRKKGFTGAKTMYDYENNLYNVFSKSFQVLKPNRYMVLTFNNKDVSAWLGLLFSIFKSGFTLSENGLFFQDGVKNYKQTAHTKADGSPYGDFIYSFKKGEPTHEIKIYHSENEFANDLDNIFKHYLADEGRDKNELIMDMFLTAIPLIESFAKTFLKNHKHNLYTKFKKDYFNQLYKNAED
jgi:putative DNA methylase